MTIEIAKSSSNGYFYYITIFIKQVVRDYAIPVYNCMIQGKQIYLFYEDNSKWFIEIK